MTYFALASDQIRFGPKNQKARLSVELCVRPRVPRVQAARLAYEVEQGAAQEGGHRDFPGVFVRRLARALRREKPERHAHHYSENRADEHGLAEHSEFHFFAFYRFVPNDFLLWVT